jgi:hypothetical protein
MINKQSDAMVSANSGLPSVPLVQASNDAVSLDDAEQFN